MISSEIAEPATCLKMVHGSPNEADTGNDGRLALESFFLYSNRGLSASTVDKEKPGACHAGRDCATRLYFQTQDVKHSVVVLERIEIAQ